LEEAKIRLDEEREVLLREKNTENREWKDRYELIMRENEDVLKSLKEANNQYLGQVGENEELKA